MFKSSCLVWITCTSMRHYHVAQKYVVHCIVASCLVLSRFLWHFWVSASRSSECFLKAVPNMNKTNANSAIIILINHWSVRIVVQLVSVVLLWRRISWNWICISWVPLGAKFFFRLKRISEALLDNSFWAVSFNSPDPFQWFFAHEIL